MHTAPDLSSSQGGQSASKEISNYNLLTADMAEDCTGSVKQIGGGTTNPKPSAQCNTISG